MDQKFAFALGSLYEYNRKTISLEGAGSLDPQIDNSYERALYVSFLKNTMDALYETIRLDQDYSRLQTYRIRNAILIRYLCLTILGWIGMLVIIIIGFWRWRYVLTHFGPAVLWRWLYPFLWSALGLGLVGGIGLYLLLFVGRQEIQLSPMGITWRKGRKLWIFPWGEIENIFITSIRYGILDFAWGRRTEVILQLQKRKRLKISQAFENIETLVETMKHYVYPLMFEKFRNAFNRGEPVQFGPMILTTQGILNGRKALRWQDVGKIQLHAGRLDLHPVDGTNGTKFSFPVYKIPNIDLCIQILHHFGPQT
jgi:hypothetical protein